MLRIFYFSTSASSDVKPSNKIDYGSCDDEFRSLKMKSLNMYILKE